MIPAANLAAFLLVVVPFVLIPGPSVLFVIGRALSLGRVGGLLSVAGNGLGALTAGVAVALGVGFVIAQSVVLFTIVKIAGAAYLIYLGVQAIRHRREAADAAAAGSRPRAAWRLLLQGYLVGLTNPKGIVFFVAVLPQFVDYRSGNVPGQMLILAAIVAGVAILGDSVWALLAGSARDWFARSPRRISTLGATGGVFMIGLGTASLFVGHGKD